jgi:hypothetical protein
MSIFQPIASDCQFNPLPVLLIDISGSTSDQFGQGVSVRDYEFTIAKKICEKTGYSQANIITWSTDADLHEKILIDDFDKIRKMTKSGGGTDLICGLKLLKESFYDPQTITEIIIITDGEIHDKTDAITSQFCEIIKHPVQFKIVAVEPNNKDYFKSGVSVGNALYKIIREGKLTRLVERFSVYNRHEVEFINMSNPKFRNGYLPYGDQMFLIKDFNHFVCQIKDEIKLLVPQEENRSCILKLIQNLSLTIYHYTKDKSYQNQMLIVDLFSNLLRGTAYYSDMRSLLINEVNNHMTGKISTFSELKKTRYIKIENNIIDLMNNVQKAIMTTAIPRDFAYSFMLTSTDGSHHVIKSYDRNLANIRMGPLCYKNCGLELQDYQIPLMFDFDDVTSTTALQWIKLIYSGRLNLSASNEHLYYYLLCDAFLARNTEVATVYNKYVELALNDYKYNSEITIAKDIEKTNMITIPYGVLQDAIRYSGLTIKPLTLYYLICHQYLLKYVPTNGRSVVVDSLRKFCEKDLIVDLQVTDQQISDWSAVEERVCVKIDGIQIIIINREQTSFIQHHQYLEDIDCPNLRGLANGVCELCGSKVNHIIIECNTTFRPLTEIKPNYLYTLQKHTHLGLLDGMPDQQLLDLEHFESPTTSYSLDNKIIVDPISNARLKITTREEFIKYVDLKYPFLRETKMDHVALCGGFVRSILLKQQMKDFDFFFYGLKSEAEYIARVKTLTEDLVKSLHKVDPTYKFALFYKPTFNVIEMICYEDPKNHIKEDFTLDYFDQYKFKSMKKYKPNRKTTDAVTNRVAEGTNAEGTSRSQKKKKVDTKYYFEDNDEHGVKMKYRFQLVMCQYETILDIFKSFDMFPSMVAYDGQHVYFTNKSLMAYQYMINEINVKGGTDLVKHRVSKYFKYGFAIVFPPSTRQWDADDYQNDYSQEGGQYKGTNENIGPIKFKVRQVVGNVIFVNHNSNMEQWLERNLKLEKKAKKNGTALYTSSMFCSFVAVLRYVKINQINYSFPLGDAIYNLFQDSCINLKTAVQLSFFTEQKSIYKTTEWYDKFVKSIILDKFQE